MPIPPSKGKLLYHMTRIQNIPSILEKGLLPRGSFRENGVESFQDIANHDILKKREEFKALSQYVPFHFFTKTPFDWAVCKDHGVDDMVIISIMRDLHLRREMFIIPSHPLNLDVKDIYPYEEGFDKVKWDLLDDEQNRFYGNHEIKEACMAECVVPGGVAVEDFCFLFVNSRETYDKVKAMDPQNRLSLKINEHMFPAVRQS